jgi:aminoglycoside phosphotransferase family enzyme/predicted kinase
MDQGRLPPHVEALLLPSTYPHSVERVELIQTHISYVLLAGEYVYKVKKPVDMGFLDYTSLEKRKFYCEQEVQLNRRLCSDAYLGIVAITVENGTVSLDGKGEVVDYAVKMKRLPAERMMERLLERGTITSEMLERLTAKLATFHAEAETSEHIQSFGGLEAVAANWRENFDQTEPYIGQTISREQFERIRAYVDRFLVEDAWLLENRVKDDRIRDCHGDLRSNAVCFEDGICVFDCIEFNDRFRYADTASDLAFLAMDIDFRGQPALSDEMVGLYLAQSLDTTLPLVLHFYKCYRAFVRGKVDGFQLDQPEIPAEQKAVAAEGARRYFALADEYASRATPAIVIALVGVTGSGKSYLGNALASRLGAVVISSDVTRKTLAGLDPKRQQPEPVDSGIYSPEMTDLTYAEMLLQAVSFLSRGKPVVLDASYLARQMRQRAREFAERAGVRFLAVECVADEPLVRERLQRRRSAVWSPSDGRWEVYQAQLKRAEALSELPENSRLSLDGALPLAEQLDRVEAFVRRAAG